MVLMALALGACTGQPAAGPARAPESSTTAQQAPGPVSTLQISAQQAPARPLTKLRVATAAVDFGYLPLFIGMEKGLFAEEGLEIEYTAMQAQTSTAALIAGELEIGPDGGAGRAAAQGAPLRTFVWLYKGTTFQLMVAPEIRTPEDLIGKTVAISSHGGTQDLATRMILEKELGIDPQRVQVLPVGYTNIPAALEARQAAAGGLNPDLAARMALLGYRKIGSSTEVMPTPFSGLATRQDFLQNRRDVAKSLTRASIRALQFIYNQPEETAALATSILGLEPEVARAALPLTREVIDPNDWGGGREAGFRLLVEMMREELNVPNLRIEDIADISVLREVQRDMGLPCGGGYRCER
jgi:NitT/TauT family transport system substrate-binding protein